jgi:hypothetical protein
MISVLFTQQTAKHLESAGVLFIVSIQPVGIYIMGIGIRIIAIGLAKRDQWDRDE